MILSRRINLIRKISLSLFILSLTALLGSLWLQNKLAEFKFTKGIDDKELSISQSYFTDKIVCSENVQDCRKDVYLNLLNYSKKLGDCFENNIERFFIIEDKIYKKKNKFLFVDNKKTNDIKPEFMNKEIELRINILETKNTSCIKNYEYYNLYKIFPFYYEILYNLKHNPKTRLGSSEKINPFIYGEASISNIVKRFPINYIFKSLLFICVFLMYLYWKNYKFLFNQILNSNNQKFFYFGIASALFLFLHVLFLGVEIDNKVFKLLEN